MPELREEILALLDGAADWCIERWQVLMVLVPAGTFVFFALTILFGLTVAQSMAAVRLLAAVEITGAIAILGLNLRYRRQRNRWLDAADAIEALLCDDDVFSDWEEFIGTPACDPDVERIRRHCLTLPEIFPPQTPRDYCNEQGIERLEKYASRLRAGRACGSAASLRSS